MWVYGLDLFGPGYQRVAKACDCGNEHSGPIKCGELISCKPVSLSRETLHRGVNK